MTMDELKRLSSEIDSDPHFGRHTVQAMATLLTAIVRYLEQAEDKDRA